MGNILLVEDDESLNRGISFKLRKEGYSVFTCRCIKEAKNILKKNNIDLVLLDVNLPDGNGFEFCEFIREKDDTLVIFLTACDQEVDIVNGYDLGADDYITKPFSLMVLISKVRAVLRRKNNKDDEKAIYTGDIAFYTDKFKVFKDKEELILSKTEFKLLKYLISNSGQVITKEQLLNELWDLEGNFVDENTVAVNISRLRKKIEEDPSNPKYIKNIRGIGYTWVERCAIK